MILFLSFLIWITTHQPSLILALKESQQIVIIPNIPTQHVLCWLRNLPDHQRQAIVDYCKSASYDYIQIDQQKDNLNLTQTICDEIILKLENDSILPCWGYESDSNEKCLLYPPVCDGPSNSWASNRQEQLAMFFDTADFGYVRQQKDQLKNYCTPVTGVDDSESSQLKCTSYIRYCQAKKIFINFGNLVRLQEPIRYREDIFSYGDIGGWNCNLKRNSLLKESGHKSPLMSWFAEISNFQNFSKPKKCDVTLKKPVFIMKLDATINMYHHFCDFINLYLSLHVNGSFSLDNHILILDTYPYRSNFAPVWKAFTKNPLLNLQEFKAKTVCIDDVIFPLLPRMIYGLYYNMPLIPGCGQSGVFRAFNRHMLHHFELKDSETLSQNDTQIKITFLKRQTKYRQILNQKQLIETLENVLIERKQKTYIDIQLVEFDHRTPFIDQIAISSSTDILIGIHGAGLTHTLFQPDYGVLFELYNCQDMDCYRDLARLRGVQYLTWEDETKLKTVVDKTQHADQNSTGAAHAKFVNYWFDQNEFVRLTLKAIEMVREQKHSFKWMRHRLVYSNHHHNDNDYYDQSKHFKNEL